MIADMDSTIIENECIDELADALGLKSTVAAITEKAMRGELNFEDALRERVAMLRGLAEGELLRVYEERIRLTPGARAMVQTLRRDGAVCVLVSGGFSFFTGRVAEAAGFNAHHANILEIEDGQLTGKVKEPILGAEAKLARLREYKDRLGLKDDEILAIGDGANDIPMIEAAGYGVAFCAKPKTEAAAKLSVRTRDLREVLYLLGYTEDQIAA